MEDSNSQQTAPNTKRSIFVLIVLIGLLGILGGYLGYQNYELKKQLEACGIETEETKEERDKIERELEGMIAQYEALETNNDSVNAELMAEKAKVEQLLKDAKNNRWTIYKLKKEASTLRDIMKGYVRTIDSLNTLNVELRAENADVKGQLKEREKQFEELSEKNIDLKDKVRMGSKLDAYNMTTIAQKMRWNNTYREVNRAKNTDQLKTCFSISENKVTEPGTKAIFIRIITPSGVVLSERSDDTFDFQGRSMLYSLKKQIEYENKSLDVCYYWEVAEEEELEEGDYVIEAYCDGFKIGTTQLSLK